MTTEDTNNSGSAGDSNVPTTANPGDSNVPTGPLGDGDEQPEN